MMKGPNKTTYICLVFDTSGTSFANNRGKVAKAVIRSLLLDAGLTGDKVAFVNCAGRFSRTIFPFTSDLDFAEKELEKARFGGTTPLASGIHIGHDLLKNEVGNRDDVFAMLVLATDGHANIPISMGANVNREIDIECRFVRGNSRIKGMVTDLGNTSSPRASEIAKNMGGKYYHTGLYDDRIYSAIKVEQKRLLSIHTI